MSATNPTILVEVLSDSTEDYDRGEKLEHYKRIESLRAVLLVSQRERAMELWSRSSGDWSRVEARAGEQLRIDALECQLDVDRVYDAAGAP